MAAACALFMLANADTALASGDCPNMLYRGDMYLNYSGDCNSAGTSGCYYQTATDPQYPELPVPDDAPKTYYRMNYSNGEWNISGSSFSSLEACING